MADETTIDQLNIEITATAKAAAKELTNLSKGLDRVAKSCGAAVTGLKNVNKALGGINKMNSSAKTSLAGVSANLKKVKDTAKQTHAPVTTLSDKLKVLAKKRDGILGLSNSFIQMRSVLFTIMFLATTVGAGFAYLVKKAMDSEESMNRFAVLVKDNASAANEWADALSNALGLDPIALKDTYATFYGMADAMNMSAEYADILSKNFTQLTYDIASVQNSNFDEVFTRLRSALSGETEAIDIYGYNIKQLNLQQELMNEGIDANVAKLSASDKAILIHNVIMKSSIGTQGDFARTMQSPANMLRILSDQFTIASRSIGYMFIPMLQAVVPYLIVFVQWVNQAAISLMSLFGLSMPDWSDYMSQLANNTTSVGAAIDDATGSADGLSDSLKEIKKNTLGFDELHILDQPTPDTGGGAGGAGAGGASGITPIGVYDAIGGAEGLNSLTKDVKAKMAELAVAMKPFLDKWKEVYALIKPVADIIWDGFKEFFENTFNPFMVEMFNTKGVGVLDWLQEKMQYIIDNKDTFGEGIGKFLAIMTVLKGLDFSLGVFKIIIPLSLWFFKLANVVGLVKIAFKGLWLVLKNGFKIIKFIASGRLVFIIGEIVAWIQLAAEAVGIFLAGISATVWWIVAIAAAVALAAYFIIKYWDEIKAFFVGIWETVLKPVVDSFMTYWNTLVEFWSGVWNTVIGIATWVWDLLKIIILVPVAMIGTMIIKWFEYARDGLLLIWKVISSVASYWWNLLYDKIAEPVMKIWDKIQEYFGKIKTFVRGIWDGLADGLSAIWDTIYGYFKWGINGIIKLMNNGPIALINTVLGWAKGADVTGILGGVNYLGEIPYLARGGMPDTGSTFLAGENGPELIGSYGGNNNTVMPLENSGFVQAVANAVYSAVSAGVQNMPDAGDIVLQMDGVKVGKGIRKAEKASGVSTGLVSY